MLIKVKRRLPTTQKHNQLNRYLNFSVKFVFLYFYNLINKSFLHLVGVDVWCCLSLIKNNVKNTENLFPLQFIIIMQLVNSLNL